MQLLASSLGQVFRVYRKAESAPSFMPDVWPTAVFLSRACSSTICTLVGVPLRIRKLGISLRKTDISVWPDLHSHMQIMSQDTPMPL
jgi:hypothetical protein